MKWLKNVGLVIVAVPLILGYGVLLWKGPWLLDGSHIRKRDLQPADGVVITGFRTMVVAVGAGILAAFGLVYTHRNHTLAQNQFKHTQQQFELAQRQFEQAQAQFEYQQQKDRESAQTDREARATEQYVTAVKLLASKSDTERLGAIYSLERIMRDSPRDSEAIEMLLATFTREREAQVESDKDWGVPVSAAPESTYGSDYDAAMHVLKEWRGTA
ncbi:hypothetical protein AB0K68_06660 [Streptomyces sp. NPDC050698]